jgi:hypothetical protein
MTMHTSQLENGALLVQHTFINQTISVYPVAAEQML